MWKERSIVMLVASPNDETSKGVWILKDRNWYHLYILSDEEIKERDWYIDDTNAIRQSVTSDKEYWKTRQNYKKIIATTDTSLTILNNYRDDDGSKFTLPQIPESFITLFIKEYNKGNIIERVEVEYNIVPCDINGNEIRGIYMKHISDPSMSSEDCINIMAPILREVIKLNLHNTINIRLKKDVVYTEEEVKELCESLFYTASQPDDGLYKTYKSFEDWFEKK